MILAANGLTFEKEVIVLNLSMPSSNAMRPNSSSEKELLTVSTPEKSNSIGTEKPLLSELTNAYAPRPDALVLNAVPNLLMFTIMATSKFLDRAGFR